MFLPEVRSKHVQKSMVRLIERLDMTIAADWDVKPQNISNKNVLLFSNTHALAYYNTCIYKRTKSHLFVQHNWRLYNVEIGLQEPV